MSLAAQKSSRPAGKTSVSVVRKDADRKDLVFAGSGGGINIHKRTRTYHAHGDIKDAYTAVYPKPVFDMVEEMSEDELKEFFSKMECEIILDIRDVKSDEEAEKQYTRIVEQFGKWGQILFKRVQALTISIMVPNTISVMTTTPLDDKVDMIVRSPGFSLVESMTKQIKSFTSLKTLDVIIRTSVTKENHNGMINMVHSGYVIPFWQLELGECAFRLMWKKEGMEAETVRDRHTEFAARQYNRVYLVNKWYGGDDAEEGSEAPAEDHAWADRFRNANLTIVTGHEIAIPSRAGQK